jgi:Protein of unknown function (DUF2891)
MQFSVVRSCFRSLFPCSLHSCLRRLRSAATTSMVAALLIPQVAPTQPSHGPETDAVTDGKRITAFLNRLPQASPLTISSEQAASLAALPVSCLDRPQAAPNNNNEYLWQRDDKNHIPEDYDKNRAFYGCYDWHSSVNSLWTLLVLMQRFPKLTINPMIRQELKDHLGQSNLAGELKFFQNAKDFEKPYGYSWLLKLQAELSRWGDPEAKTLVANLDPLAKFFSGKLITYFNELPYAMRTGVHQNTAFSMNLVLDATDVLPDTPLRTSVMNAARRLFLHDTHCPTAYEPGGTEFLSPCLTEAKLMGRVLGQQEFATWLDAFLPPIDSDAFSSELKAVDVSSITSEDLQPGKSHLIGLAWQRAEAMLSIAAKLPANDPRVPALRRVAALNAQNGMDGLLGAGYLGSHWLATFVAMYMEAQSPVAMSGTSR